MPIDMRERQIAETILDQIRAGRVRDAKKLISGRHAMMCWGSRNFRSMPQSHDSLAGLRFHVAGLKFQGIVYIKLAHDDTYTIELWNKIADNTPAQTIPNIYCVQLTEVLDSHIETGR